MDDLGRRRADDEAGQPAEPVRAEDEQRVLLPFDLGDERSGGAAAHDLARWRSRPDLVASAPERPRGGLALEVFVHVGGDVGAGSADRRGDVVRREQRQFAVDENRRLACRLAALFGPVDSDQDATEHRASRCVRGFGAGVHGVAPFLRCTSRLAVPGPGGHRYAAPSLGRVGPIAPAEAGDQEVISAGSSAARAPFSRGRRASAPRCPGCPRCRRAAPRAGRSGCGRRTG